MPGAISPNFHEGSRSEYLAQYCFSSWGTAVPVPHQEDHGLDMYCTLVETIDHRAWAKAPYTVQVKSSMQPWQFAQREAVRWLVEHPLPLFLCVVDKAELRIRLYQTSQRFYLWGRGHFPERIELVPTDSNTGEMPRWLDGTTFELSAPIVDFTMQQFLEDGFPIRAQAVIESWIKVDSENLHRMRAGIRTFVVPYHYETNKECTKEPTASFVKVDQPVSDIELDAALPSLRDSLEFVGHELFKRKDHYGATFSALLFRHLFHGKASTMVRTPRIRDIEERVKDVIDSTIREFRESERIAKE